MVPQDVIANVHDMEIWHNKVWINHEEQVYFVPIWRNGNTEFMYLAEKFGYVLDKLENSEYTGYAFIRHPAKRIAGQIWRGMTNQGFTLKYCIEHLATEVDPHFRTQQSFLDDYKCKYLLDLDDLQPVGHDHIDTVIRYMLLQDNKIIYVDADGNIREPQSVNIRKHDIQKQLLDYKNEIETAYHADYKLYYSNSNIVINEAKECRVCKSEIDLVADFGSIHINDFPLQPGYSKGKVPMILDRCKQCSLVQMRHTVNPQILYGDHYWYESALNPKIKTNLLQIAEIANSLTEPGDCVLDIGANDGTLLSGIFKDRVRIGCEPAGNLWSKLCEHADVVLPAMWDSSKLHHKCKVVTAIGMFYDMDDPNDFIQGISEVLTKDGIFIAQLMTLRPMLEQNDLGNICHEHLEYYSYPSLVKLYEQNGLQIFDVKQNDIQGGSYQIWASPYRSGSIQYYENIDHQMDEFVKRVEQNGLLLKTILRDARDQGAKCYVYGASTKGNTMLQIWQLGNYFDGAAEIHPDKIGRYTVGTNIPIVHEDEARKNADVFFVPNFGFKTMFIEKEKEWINNGGTMVFAMPDIEVINKEQL